MVRVNLNTNTIKRGRRSVKVWPRVAELAALLLKKRGEVVRYTDLIYGIWGLGHEPENVDKCLQTHAVYLRRACRDLGVLLRTYRGIGYRLD